MSARGGAETGRDSQKLARFTVSDDSEKVLFQCRSMLTGKKYQWSLPRWAKAYNTTVNRVMHPLDELTPITRKTKPKCLAEQTSMGLREGLTQWLVHYDGLIRS